MTAICEHLRLLECQNKPGGNWWEANRSLNNLLYGHQYDVQNLCYLLQTLHLKHAGVQT